MPEYIDTKMLAEMTSTKPNTWERKRSSRDCPFRWVKLGGKVLYDRAEVLAYLESQKRDRVDNVLEQTEMKNV